MANEHDKLIEEYQRYKDEVAEYEKKLFHYESEVSRYAEEIIKQVGELKKLGINLEVLKKYAKEDGSIDLTNQDIVRGMISDVYEMYQSTVKEGLDILEQRKKNNV